MSNQEQQFYSSEQQPPSPQQSYQYYGPSSNVNADPREQQSQEMYGEPEYYTGRGEKLQPHPRRRKRLRAFWVIPIVLLFIIGGMSFGLFGSHDSSYKHFHSPGDAQVFSVSKGPKLVINDTNGTVHIHSDSDSGNGNTITVRMDRSGRSNVNQFMTYNKGANTLTIDTTPLQNSDDNSVDIDITTPKASDVKVTDANGDVQVEDVTGNVNVQTTQGGIDAHDVSGQVTLTSTDGDVSLDGGSLSGRSSLHSDNGDVSYNGSIDPQGSYKFDTINGSINVGLPSDSTFHLDAHGTNGDLNNEFGSVDVGNGPLLIVSSENGSVHISKNG